MTSLPPSSPPTPQPDARAAALDAPMPPALVSIPAGELAELRQRASGLRVISRTVITVVAILGLASVLIVALALVFD